MGDFFITDYLSVFKYNHQFGPYAHFKYWILFSNPYVNQNIEFKTNVIFRNFEIDCRIQLEISELVTSWHISMEDNFIVPHKFHYV